HDDFQAYWLADLLYNDQQYKAAVEVLAKTMIEGEPDYYDHAFMALLGVEIEDGKLAQKHIDIALEIRPDAAYPYYYQSLLYLDEGNIEEADSNMKIAVENGLAESSIRHYLQQLMKSGEYVHAIRLGVELRKH
ncbi:MAG: hypothetical protein AAGF53_10365, partial [Pseudomonadota bacterium]